MISRPVPRPPLNSSSDVSNVHAFSAVPWFASGVSRSDSAAAAVSGFKLEDRFNRACPRARHAAGRGPMGSRPETGRSGSADMRLQLSHDRVQAADRSDVPGQGQHIAPMAVGMKQGLEQNLVRFRERPFELRKPIVHGRRDGCFFRFCQHSHSQAIDPRGVSRLCNLPRPRLSSEGSRRPRLAGY